MSAQYINISLTEMEEFLVPLGFSRIDPGKSTREVVYAKGFKGAKIKGAGYIRLSLRIYTGINISNGQSRPKGGDAIRATLWAMLDNKPIMLSGTKRVHRVVHWRENLLQRINRWQEELLGALCPHCSAPMIEKKRRDGKGSFLGCIRYPQCKGLRCLHQNVGIDQTTCPDCGQIV